MNNCPTTSTFEHVAPITLDPTSPLSKARRAQWHLSAAHQLGGRGAGYAQPCLIAEALSIASLLESYPTTVTPQDHLAVLAILMAKLPRQRTKWRDNFAALFQEAQS